jgi:hypothetical protein
LGNRPKTGRRKISAEETDDPRYADDRNFHKVETWTKDALHITGLLYAGNSLDGLHPVPKTPS